MSAVVVHEYWLFENEEPEIVGVYEYDAKGYAAASERKDILEGMGYKIGEDVFVNVEYVKIIRDETISKEEIELVMNALAGHPIVTTSELADRVERILKKYM